MVILLATWAQAATVQCDPAVTSRLVDEARIDPNRIPVTHPELVPGLALAAAETGGALRDALLDLCSREGGLSIVVGDRWDTPSWSAHTLLLTHHQALGDPGCGTRADTVAISVATLPGQAPRYGLRGPPSRQDFPTPACDLPDRWREERVVAGEAGPVRLVVVTSHDDEAVAAQLVVRRAGDQGWHEQVLLDPAPPRYQGGDQGPIVSLTQRFADDWIVVHGDRALTEAGCAPVPGQTVWRWTAPPAESPPGEPPTGPSWTSVTDREALAALATRGLWRLAGQDGWFLISAQDEEADRRLLEARVRRRERRFDEEPWLILESSAFPGLNPGYLVATTWPYATELEARAARQRLASPGRVYVKRAWKALNPCSP